ncbi:MAG: hypothetical protein CMJ47_11915 [Planctomyces sp.]|nr:hypothetical protein [Planctomyces sp.]
MPVQINIGLNKKVGEANYGSRGASVNLQVELDSGIVDDADRLRNQIHKLFGLARQSLDAELQRGVDGPGDSQATNGHHIRNGDRQQRQTNGRRKTAGRMATSSQVRALYAIAKNQQIDLQAMLAEFGVSAPEDLTVATASQLIDELNNESAGAGGPR